MLHVENATRGDQVVVSQGRVANRFWPRFRGLMGVRCFAEGDGLVLVPCRAIHCMFMAIPIDVIYVGDGERVIALDRAMRPWSIGRVYAAAHYVLELPAGTIQRTGTEIGDRLKVSF